MVLSHIPSSRPTSLKFPDRAALEVRQKLKSSEEADKIREIWSPGFYGPRGADYIARGVMSRRLQKILETLVAKDRYLAECQVGGVLERIVMPEVASVLAAEDLGITVTEASNVLKRLLIPLGSAVPSSLLMIYEALMEADADAKEEKPRKMATRDAKEKAAAKVSQRVEDMGGY
ncbi:hypothetical protein EJ06DRAFT_560553 [Trichodelitschia bisporula]|uniref:Restriction of telomere capping protein 4 C-terminal domain-containing protein n=1 Tax=Trichodelitschia bisporula TaxID=703511 RepID=A0A6G1HIF0_9PEZI|nr:hypothetical protein EJ06DRAFT_560553 [Trichodelitschia bisporula]